MAPAKRKGKILDVKIENKFKHANEVGSQNKNHTVSKSRHQERDKFWTARKQFLGSHATKKTTLRLKDNLSFSSLF